MLLTNEKGQILESSHSNNFCSKQRCVVYSESGRRLFSRNDAHAGDQSGIEKRIKSLRMPDFAIEFTGSRRSIPHQCPFAELPGLAVTAPNGTSIPQRVNIVAFLKRCLGEYMIPAYINWSGGKDSSLALYYLLQNPEFTIKALVTTVNEAHQRISMHGVRRELLHEQAKQIGIPVHEILLPDSPNMSDYETAMNEGLKPLLDQGIRHCAFGDIFLEDLRKYREDKLAEIGVEAVFPLWKRDTKRIDRNLYRSRIQNSGGVHASR